MKSLTYNYLENISFSYIFFCREYCILKIFFLPITFKIYRIFPGGDIEFLHPKDGVFPEKVNEGREKVGHNPRRIGENPNPAGLKFTTKNTFD